MRIRKSFYRFSKTLVEDRDNLVDYLEKNGVEVMIHQSMPLSKSEFFAKKIDKNIFYNPKANKVTTKVLSLPIYPYLSDNEVTFLA